MSSVVFRRMIPGEVKKRKNVRIRRVVQRESFSFNRFLLGFS